MDELLQLLRLKYPHADISCVIEHTARMKSGSLKIKIDEVYWLHINDWDDNNIRFCQKFETIDALCTYVKSLPAVKGFVSPSTHLMSGAAGNNLGGYYNAN